MGKSKRQHDLLFYLLNEKQLGRLDEITQYSIAKKVLGRGGDFDPITDSIVRVEMHRLRKNLAEFNKNSDDLQIDIPAASFSVNVIHKKQDTQSLVKMYQKPAIYLASAMSIVVIGLYFFMSQEKLTAKASNCSSIIPNISVENTGGKSDLQLYVEKLIRSTLSQFSNIQLVDDIKHCANSGTPSYVLDYLILEKENTYQTAFTAYSGRPSNIISFKNAKGNIASSGDKDSLYYDVVKTLGDLVKPYGTLPRHSLTQKWGSEQAASNYKCLIMKYDSYTTDSPREYDKAAKCLRDAAKTDIASLDIKAGMAEDYLFQAKGYRKKAVDDPMSVVQRVLEDAGENWIDSVEMTTIKIGYEAERSDYIADRMEEILSVSKTRYNENPIILIYVSMYYGLRLGEWDEAKIISDKVKRINSDTDDSTYTVEAIYGFLNNPPQKIMESCRPAYSQNSLFSNLIINACARKAQDMKWIEKTDANLSKLGYPTKTQRVKFIKNKKMDEKVAENLISALKLPPN